MSARGAVWALLMLLWAAALLSGVWWIWPTLAKLDFSVDLIASIVWWLMGALAWLVALNYGRAKYWRRD